MLNTTLPDLRCPRRKKANSRCEGTLILSQKDSPSIQKGPSPDVFEIRSGRLECTQCHSQFPILAGVLLLVDQVRDYILGHVKGITQVVPDSEIPKEYFHEFCEARDEIQSEHIEEDLEAERVNALYVMNHYLSAGDSKPGSTPWWLPQKGQGSAVLDRLVREYWDQGPLAQIEKWIFENDRTHLQNTSVVELGCGVGGLCKRLAPRVKHYLGVDSSFASIAIARHLALGMPYSGKIQIPEDLLQGPVSRPVGFEIPKPFQNHSDFIVGDLDYFPIQKGKWDVAVSLNTIDMLDDPASLPALQFDLLKKDGRAIQSCPYIWHPEVARRLRKRVPGSFRDQSAEAVRWLYEQAGFQIEKDEREVPWLFFKHVRQMEIYSVHAFTAKKHDHKKQDPKKRS